jgi:hypothetical protein
MPDKVDFVAGLDFKSDEKSRHSVSCYGENEFGVIRLT